MEKLKFYMILALFLIQSFLILNLILFKEEKHIVHNMSNLHKQAFDISHLTQNNSYVFGPQQDDEALLIYSIIKVTKPKVVVETGMYEGYSSVNILAALENNSRLFTYDIVKHNPSSKAFRDKRFKFILKSQADFNHDDVDNLVIDMAILDDGHIFEVEQEFWRKLITFLSPNALVLIHDTGLHINYFDKVSQYCTCDFEKKCGYVHQDGERRFVNWIIDNYPQWRVVNFHSYNVFRHGLTVLQRNYKFNTAHLDDACMSA